MRPRLLNLDPYEYSEKARKMLLQYYDLDEVAMNYEELLTCIENYDILVLRFGCKIDKRMLEKAKRLKLIATATTGLNHIDVCQAKKQKINILSLKGESDFLAGIHATAEHTWTLLLTLIRKIPQALCSVKNGEWDRDQFKGRELYGKTLGIIGYGRLGKKVARYGNVFGMRVMACDKTNVVANEKEIEFISLEKLLASSDVISLHVNYTPENHAMISRNEFLLMKQNAVFLNTSRGELIDEEALLEVLHTKKIAGAALDVLCGENTGLDGWARRDSLIQYAARHDNLMITPHLGGCTHESLRKVEEFIAEKICQCLWLI